MKSHFLLLRLISCLLLALSTLAYSADITHTTSLDELAQKADLVAVAQVRDTDYVYTRSFPSEGSAFLGILIVYKSAKSTGEIIQVNEKGLRPNECYFENPTVLEEGRRFLVFLRQDPEDPENYRGLQEGCALEILVTRENRYALKFPVEGISLANKLDKLVVKYDFRDNYALVSDEVISPPLRDDLLTSGLIIPYQGKFKYTHGIDLTEARKLIGTESLKSSKYR